MAREWMRFIVPLSGRTAKVLVVDLDNTLWGGVIGEDGMAGIKVGAEYPGAAFQSLHRALLDLSRKGILLAVCSKNNLDDAMEALEKHPGMLVRAKHFAAMRINWTDKAQNLREIAAELNVGIDSLAFVDDNPFEREQVRAALPEVTVIDLPKNPLEYAAAVRNCAAFERLALSAEDQQRTGMYAAQKQRAGAEQSFQSKEDFFRFLEQEAELEPVSDLTLARVAQLTQKDQPVQPDHPALYRGADRGNGQKAGLAHIFDQGARPFRRPRPGRGRDHARRRRTVRDRYFPVELPRHRKDGRSRASRSSRRKRSPARTQAAGGLVSADKEKCSGARFL